MYFLTILNLIGFFCREIEDFQVNPDLEVFVESKVNLVSRDVRVSLDLPAHL